MTTNRHRMRHGAITSPKQRWLLALGLSLAVLSGCQASDACPEPSTTDGRTVCDGRLCDPGFHCVVVDGETGGSVGVCETGCTQRSECAAGLVCERGGGGLAGVCRAPAPACPGGAEVDAGVFDAAGEDGSPGCACDATPDCEAGCDCDDDCPACHCDATPSCDATEGSPCDCDTDCRPDTCACDTSSACDDTEGSSCRCDTDCRPDTCECDGGLRCTPGCSCDPQCAECACDTDGACSEGCACDRDCASDCDCDTDASCSPGCACDADCLCTNTCDYAGDGECDDGGPGADYEVCALGTDCTDCGPRACGCGELECGTGPCGESCGRCAGEDVCNAGRCEAVEPTCESDRRPAPYCDVGCECDLDCPFHACESSTLEVGDECGPGGELCCQEGLRCSCTFAECTPNCRALEYSSCRFTVDCFEGLRCVDGFCESGEG